MRKQRKYRGLIVVLILVFLSSCASPPRCARKASVLPSGTLLLPERPGNADIDEYVKANPSFAAQVAGAGETMILNSEKENFKNIILPESRKYKAFDLSGPKITFGDMVKLCLGLGLGAAFGVVGAKSAPWRSSGHNIADGVISGISGTSFNSSTTGRKWNGKLPELSQKELAPEQMEWLKSIPGAFIYAWMPADQAPGASSAQEKLLKIINQAIEQTPEGGGIRLLRCNPPESKPIPPFIAQNIGQDGQSWAWIYHNTITFSPSLYDPDKKVIYAKFDDVSFWKQVSTKLPKWCFIVLNKCFTSDGEYLLWYPQVVWQGKTYLFVNGATGSSQVTASKKQ